MILLLSSKFFWAMADCWGKFPGLAMSSKNIFPNDTSGTTLSSVDRTIKLSNQIYSSCFHLVKGTTIVIKKSSASIHNNMHLIYTFKRNFNSLSDFLNNCLQQVPNLQRFLAPYSINNKRKEQADHQWPHTNNIL